MPEWTTITQHNFSAQLYIPSAQQVLDNYRLQQVHTPDAPKPYWARLWPSAVAISSFISSNPQYVKGRQVLELAAGLGLPSIVAAPLAKQVCCSDYLPEAVALLQQSMQRNGFSNVECRLLNWHHLPGDLQAETLVMSDINYDTAEFEQLYQVLERFINQGTTVLLSTPQRLMGKPFIERLLPWSIQAQEMEVWLRNDCYHINVFALNSRL